MLIEIFKTGTHTDSNGNTRTWTEKDLDAIIAQYNPQEHEAPVVIGHPKDNAPAFGWVEGLQRKGSVLYAKLKDLVPEFVDMVKKGMYKKRSISLYPDMTLRHVGFLGAVPPSVKGLADIKFAKQDEFMSYEFSDYRLNVISNIFQRLRDWIIEKFGIEMADKIINNYDIDYLRAETEESESAIFTEVNKEFFKKEDDMEKIQELEKELKETKDQLAKFSEESKSKDSEIAELKSKVSILEAEKRKIEFQAFCEELMKEGKITPAILPAVLDFMEILHGSAEYEFAESDDKRVKKAPLEAFKTFLKALPKHVEFSEYATKNKAQDTGDIKSRREKLISEYMEKNPNTTYKQAVLAVLKEQPELREEG